MSIIADVQRDLASLKTDPANLRKFGLTVGAVLLPLGAWIWWHKHAPAVGGTIIAAGVLLLLFGAAAPALLRRAYLIWMGAAITMGWFVSRLLLILMFYCVVVPIGLAARLVGKRFLDLPKRGERETMWVPRLRKASQYEKMY
jgi:hypothetical protein